MESTSFSSDGLLIPMGVTPITATQAIRLGMPAGKRLRRVWAAAAYLPNDTSLGTNEIFEAEFRLRLGDTNNSSDAFRMDWNLSGAGASTVTGLTPPAPTRFGPPYRVQLREADVPLIGADNPIAANLLQAAFMVRWGSGNGYAVDKEWIITAAPLEVISDGTTAELSVTRYNAGSSTVQMALFLAVMSM